MTSKLVNGKKYREYIAKNNIISAEICRKAGVHHTYATNATGLAINGGQNEKCKVNEIYWNLICDALNLPRDYFDVKETPKPEPAEEPEPEDKEECLVDLADIQLSLYKIEALLQEQNKLLRGKLERGGIYHEGTASTSSARIINRNPANDLRNS